MQTTELAAKLAALHDIVVPPPVPWWPPAPGWYAIAALIVCIAGWAVWRAYRHWRSNAYRRAALRRLASIRVELANPSRRAATLTDLAALLRRAALHIAPRERVAAASGDPWLAFLDAGIGGDTFRSSTGRLLLSAPYQSADAIAQIPRPDLDALCALVERWLREHRMPRDASVA
jgi:Domain of unknown function (DUF4381)